LDAPGFHARPVRAVLVVLLAIVVLDVGVFLGVCVAARSLLHHTLGEEEVSHALGLDSHHPIQEVVVLVEAVEEEVVVVEIEESAWVVLLLEAQEVASKEALQLLHSSPNLEGLQTVRMEMGCPEESAYAGGGPLLQLHN